MKVYILYSDPYDEGAEVYGAFSTEEKVEKAIELFARKANHELYVMELEVDALEKHFERALSDKRLYIGHLTKYTSLFGGELSGKWSFSICGLDSFLEKEKHENTLCEFGHYLSATVVAKSEKEAQEIVDRLMTKLKDQPKEELGWRYITE